MQNTMMPRPQVEKTAVVTSRRSLSGPKEARQRGCTHNDQEWQRNALPGQSSETFQILHSNIRRKEHTQKPPSRTMYAKDA